MVSMSGLSPDQLKDLYFMARAIIWQYNLESIGEKELQQALKITMKAGRELAGNIGGILRAPEKLRADELLDVIDELTLGIKEQLTGNISNIASMAGQESYYFHADTLSFGGRRQINFQALSAEQFRSFFKTTDIGGEFLGGWINRAFDSTVIAGVREELQAGALLGEGYKKIVNRITSGFSDMTKREAITVARTYFQTANVTAMQVLYEQNQDVVKKWKWSATLEHGYRQSGNGTCLYCASMDGREWNVGEGPAIPAHPRCRCFPVAQTVTFREIGFDIDEFKEVARPWTERPDIPVDEGGRNIINYGFHKGDYATWFESLGKKAQVNALGPGRYELWKSGRVKFKDFADAKTGRIKRIDELRQ